MPAAAQYGTPPSFAKPEPTPAPEVRIEQRIDAQVPLDLQFRDENGQACSLGDVCGGKPVILTLAWFRCPRLCSVALNGLLESLNRLDYEIGREFNVVTVSIDPKETSRLAYAKKGFHVQAYGRPGAAQGWHFLTGDEANIQRLADTVGYRYYLDSEKGEYVHAAGLILLTPEGKVSRYFYGIDYPVRDLRYGLQDAAEGKIGSPVAQALRMLCYGYDPDKGAYTFLVLRVVRFAGALTLVGVTAMLAFLWRRERRRARRADP